MKFHHKIVHGIFTSFFLVTLAWDIFLNTLPSHTTNYNYWYNLIYGSIFLFGAAITISQAIRFSLKTNIGKMLFFFGLGLFSFWCGNMIWAFYTFFLQTEIPFPSFADIGYSLMYPLMAIGMIYLLWIYKTLITKGLIRDSIIIIIISFFIIFGFFAKPDLAEGLPLLQKFINVYYPVGDVIILSIGFMAIRIGGGKMHPSLYILSIGLLLFTAADLVFTYRNAVEVYWNGDLSDVLYSSGGYFISLGLFEIIASLSQASPAAIAPLSPDVSPSKKFM